MNEPKHTQFEVVEEAVTLALDSLFPDDSQARASWAPQIERALIASLPAIRTQLDQQWEERTKELEHERDKAREDAEQYREGWLIRGRQMNQDGEELQALKQARTETEAGRLDQIIQNLEQLPVLDEDRRRQLEADLKYLRLVAGETNVSVSMREDCLYAVGDVLGHPAGSEWELIEHVGGAADDWRGRCVTDTERPGVIGGEKVGNVRTFHREYMDRTFRRVSEPATLNQPVPGDGNSSSEVEELRDRIVKALEAQVAMAKADEVAERCHHGEAIESSLRRRTLEAALTVVHRHFNAASGFTQQAVPGDGEGSGVEADPDYSPEYQDEYQRLWHIAARQRDVYKASLDRIRAAAESDADLEELGGLRGFLIHEATAASANADSSFTQPAVSEVPGGESHCVCKVAENREAAMVEAYPGVWCDPCIAPLVKALNKGGVPTVASCCGHGSRPGNIALEDGRELVVLPDFGSARALHDLISGTQPGSSICTHKGLDWCAWCYGLRGGNAGIDPRISNVRFRHPVAGAFTEGIDLRLALQLATDNSGAVEVFLSDHESWFTLVEGPAWRINTLRAALSEVPGNSGGVTNLDLRDASLEVALAGGKTASVLGYVIRHEDGSLEVTIRGDEDFDRDELLAALDAAPTQPQLSDEDREELERIAKWRALSDRERAFLRKLASQQGEGK